MFILLSKPSVTHFSNMKPVNYVKDRRRLWLFPIMQAIFFMTSDDKNMNRPTGYLITVLYWESLIKQQ